MGCFGRFGKEKDVKLPAKAELLKDRRVLTGFLEVQERGDWQQREGVVTSSGILILYAESDLGKMYKLVNMNDLQMRKTSTGIEVKLVTCDKRKLKLRVKGEEARLWAARFFQPMGEQLGHQGHLQRVPPFSTGSRSTAQRTSRASLEESRFSYSLSLDSSEESIPRLLEEGQATGEVHTILTDTTISMVEKRERISSLAGSKREQKKAATMDLSFDFLYDSFSDPENIILVKIF